MKKFLTAIIFLGVTAAFYLQPMQATIGQGTLESDPLYQAFSVSGAAAYELNVQGWAKINSDYMTMDQLKQVVAKTKDGLGIDREFTAENSRQDNMRGITAIKELEPGEYAVIVAQTLKNPGQAAETYLIVTLSRAGDVTNLNSYRQKVTGAFEYFTQVPRVSSWLTGTLPGKLTTAESNKLLEEMFTAAGVNQTEGVSDERIVSLSGYTPNIDQYVTVGQRKINLNIAVRHHINDDKTYVYLGSPLLDGEY